jgi:putative redox protein
MSKETVQCATEQPNEFPQTLQVRQHTFRADVGPSSGGEDSAPGPHDYFDAALAACKALTATWYAKKNGIPLERVETRVERDDAEERTGRYVLKVKVTLYGANLTDAERTRVLAAVGKCPVHKLMTSTDVVIETEEDAAP